MEYSFCIAMFKPILCPDRHNCQRKLWRALIKAESGDVDKGDMRMEALKVGCDVSCQSMARWESKVWNDIAKVFK